MTIDSKDLLGASDKLLLHLAPDATHQHRKGGLYRYLGLARDADTGVTARTRDGAYLVVYEHIFPHTRGLWIRRKSEGDDGRFRELKP